MNHSNSIECQSCSGTLKNVKESDLFQYDMQKNIHIRQGPEAKRASGQFMFPLKCVVE